MKLTKLILLAIAVASTSSAFAATGIFGSYINVTSSNHGGSATWYDLTPPGGSRNSNPTDFDGFSFGTFDPSMAGTLNLTGVEVLTYKNAGGDVTGVQFSYRIYLQSGAGGAYTNQNVGFSQSADPNNGITFNDAAGTVYGSGGDQKWANTSGWQPVNLLTGLPNGAYFLEVFPKATSNQGDRFAGDDSNRRFKASFTVVPEASTSLLGVIGTLLLLRRRR